MSGPFAPGEIVVCVFAQPREFTPNPTGLVEGRYYRVLACPFWSGWADGPAYVVQIDGPKAPPLMPSAGEPEGWNDDRFRRVAKADPAFTEAMRAIKPVRKTVKA